MTALDPELIVSACCLLHRVAFRLAIGVGLSGRSLIREQLLSPSVRSCPCLFLLAVAVNEAGSYRFGLADDPLRSNPCCVGCKSPDPLLPGTDPCVE